MMYCKCYIEPPRGTVSCIIKQGGYLIEQALNRVFSYPILNEQGCADRIEPVDPCIPDKLLRGIGVNTQVSAAN